MHKGLFSLFLAGAMTVSAASSRAADISLSQVVLRGLDKVTGRLSTMTVNVGEKAEFGALDIYARVCVTHPPEETPENAAFLQVIEKKPEGQLKLFSGWMFSSSPALSAMEHPVYDVWVIKCQGDPVAPPSPAPLILDNPLEMKAAQPKLKITVEDGGDDTNAPFENVQGSLSAADEATMLIRVEEEGVVPATDVPAVQGEASSANEAPLSVPAGTENASDVEVIEEPIEGNAPILRALPDEQKEERNEAPVAETENVDGTAVPHISVSEGNYVPPEEDVYSADTDDNIAEIPDGRILHIVPSSSSENERAPIAQEPSDGTVPAEDGVYAPSADGVPPFGTVQGSSAASADANASAYGVSSPVAEKYMNDPVPSYGFDELPPMQTRPADNGAVRVLSSEPIMRDEAPHSVDASAEEGEILSEELVTEETAEY